MATQAFLDRWRSKQGPLEILATIALPRTDGTQVDIVYAGFSGVITPANSANGDPARAWTSLIHSVDRVHAPGAFGSTDLPLVRSGMTLYADRLVTLPAGIGPELTLTLADTLSTHLWTNAKVTLYRWFTDLTDFQHAQVVLMNASVVGWSISVDGLQVALRQSTEWNRSLTPRTVGRHEFPRAPDAAVGMSLPIVYGDLTFKKLRRPWPRNPNLYFATLDAATNSTSRHIRGVMVDTGRGGSATQNLRAKVVVAGHAMNLVYHPNVISGSAVWLDDEGKLLQLDYSTNVFNDIDKAGISLPDDVVGWYGVVPSDIVAVANTAQNPRHVLDVSDATFAYFNPDAALNFNELRARVDVPENVTTKIVLGYRSTSTLAAMRLWHTYGGNPGTYVYYQDIPPSTSPAIIVTAPGISPTGGFAIQDIALRFYAPNPGGGSTTPAGEMQLFFFGVLVQGPPKRTMVQSERVIETRTVPIPITIAGTTVRLPKALGPFTHLETIPPVTEMQGSFYANSQGYKDDGAGTYTDSPNALIERAPDIIAHMLTVYGGLPLSKLERTVGAMGSFRDARALLKVANGLDSKHAMSLVEGVDILTAMQWLTQSSLMQPILSPYDDIFRLIVWANDLQVNYGWRFGKRDLMEQRGPDVEPTPLTDVISGVRVAYAYDAKGNTQRAEVALAPDRSVAGDEYQGIRDQNMIVVAGKNDRFDFMSNFQTGVAKAARTAVMTPGVYVPQSALSPATGQDYIEGFAQQWKGQMAWAEGTQASGSRYQCTWGTMVTGGYNDMLAITRNAVLINVLLDANDGSLTCEQLAAHVQAKVRVAFSVSTFDCGYDRTLQKYWIRVTESAPWRIKHADTSDYTAARMQRSAWASLGFYQGGADSVIPLGTQRFAEDQRIERHFGFMSLGGSGGGPPSVTFEWEPSFQSGANSADSATAVRHCADLMGFTSSSDRTVAFSGNNGHSYCADGPKGNLETIMAEAATLYGARREMTVQSRTIQDTDTALALRDRMANMFRAPRPLIKFSTQYAPDIERGHVFDFDPDVDDLSSYAGAGTDGSWAGKKFMCVEYAHAMGPATLATEVVAVDIAKLAAIAITIGIGYVLVGGPVAVRLL